MVVKVQNILMLNISRMKARVGRDGLVCDRLPRVQKIWRATTGKVLICTRVLSSKVVDRYIRRSGREE